MIQFIKNLFKKFTDLFEDQDVNDTYADNSNYTDLRGW